MKQNLIAEASLKEALNQIGATVDQFIDTPPPASGILDKGPIIFSQNLAEHKAQKLLEEYKRDGVFIASSKVVALGRRILPVAIDDDAVKQNLRKISGRRHRVYVSVCFIKKQEDILIKKAKTAISILKIKRLTEEEIESYVISKQGLNMPGGYDSKGLACSFVIFFSGSLAAIQDLPLYETRNMLLSLGLKLI